jgi:stress-induced morphogen
MVKILRLSDQAVEQVGAALEEYEDQNPGSESLVYRYNPASIRVKIVDPAFHGHSKGERHDHVWQFLQRLPEDVLSQISVLLCLDRGEPSFLDAEFHDAARMSA